MRQVRATQAVRPVRPNAKAVARRTPPRAKPAERRPQQRSVDTRERLVDAALAVFGDVGFEGASTREIVRRAGVALAALPYHFTTKDALWRAAADRIFGELTARIGTRLQGLDGVDRPTQLRLVLREFVRFSAERPELHRFMMQVAFTRSERLAWLVETHVRPMYDFVGAIVHEAQGPGRAPAGRRAHLHYLLVGAATAPYVMRAEFELLTGADPRGEDLIAEHAAMLERMLFPMLTDAPLAAPSRTARKQKSARGPR
jgi:TetR/AcrR family transcriptional regulator